MENETITFAMDELRPSTIIELIETLAEADPQDDRIERLEAMLFWLVGGSPAAS